MEKDRAPRNRTLTMSEEESLLFGKRAITLDGPASLSDILDRTIHGDFFSLGGQLPGNAFDLAIVDPPYNIDKDFNGTVFRAMGQARYAEYVESWLLRLLPLLKTDASIYVCCDWKSSAAVSGVLERHVTIRNRISWQREKGRGALANWKNCVEDIWFATKGSEYYFDVAAVRMKRRVLAPYRKNGKPKDWDDTDDGKFRLTCPSNFWDDISVPYWSMPENTDHPTQKPEKLVAKLILASSPPGALVFDPFLGSGTTSVVAKKLGRRYVGIEVDGEYCAWAEKRLERAEGDKAIQGYTDGVFWERNTRPVQKGRGSSAKIG